MLAVKLKGENWPDPGLTLKYHMKECVEGIVVITETNNKVNTALKIWSK